MSQRVFLPVAGVVLILDQFAKYLAVSFLVSGESRPVFPGLFNLTLIRNEGIAFGLFHDLGAFLFGLITVSIAVLAVLGLRTDPSRILTQAGIGLILGGALGNWVDRLRVGAVIDFLDFRVWPVFNLGASAITLGVGILLWELFFLKKTGPRPPSNSHVA